jgi:hypothetical protein
VPASVAAFASNLTGDRHGLFVGDFDPNRPRAEQLAPGFLPMVTEFLRAA